MTTSLDDLSPDRRAEFEAAMAKAAERFESGEFGGTDPEFKDIDELPATKQLAHARYLRAQLEKDRDAVDVATERAVAAARKDDMSWGKIGNALDVTGQYARVKYGKKLSA